MHYIIIITIIIIICLTLTVVNIFSIKNSYIAVAIPLNGKDDMLKLLSTKKNYK